MENPIPSSFALGPLKKLHHALLYVITSLHQQNGAVFNPQLQQVFGFLLEKILANHIPAILKISTAYSQLCREIDFLADNTEPEFDPSELEDATQLECEYTTCLVVLLTFLYSVSSDLTSFVDTAVLITFMSVYTYVMNVYTHVLTRTLFFVCHYSRPVR